MTGYLTAQPTQTGVYTYLHDTAIAGVLTHPRIFHNLRGVSKH